MAATRTRTNLHNAATSTATSSNIDCSTDYAREVYVKIVQVGTASTAASFRFDYSTDGTNYTFSSPTYSAGTAAATYNWVVSLPVGFVKFNMVYTQQSGGTSSTATADVMEVSTV
jgi:hypothetical protein